MSNILSIISDQLAGEQDLGGVDANEYHQFNTP